MNAAAPTLLATSASRDSRISPAKPLQMEGSRFYRPELDLVRFLAFSFVFLHHSLQITMGAGSSYFGKAWLKIVSDVGVASGFGLNLFFTLSAFLICELLLREKRSTNSVNAKAFYIRRILRIWPLYFVGLAMAALIALSSGPDWNSLSWAGWAAVLMGNWFVVAHGFPGSPMGPLWSISVEEQFYLIAPFTVKLLNRWALGLFAIALIALSIGAIAISGAMKVSSESLWTNSFVQFQSFAAGILICLVSRERGGGFSKWTRLTLFASGLFCWYIVSDRFNVRYPSNSHPEAWKLIAGYMTASIGCSMLLVSFLGVSKRFPRWIYYLGRISFGLYVYHMLAIRIAGSLFGSHLRGIGLGLFMRGATAMGLTVLSAMLSYKFLETPFLKLKKRHEIIASRPI
jgi:peptidoglycan/LPS O-acetylase OafA/YrhL